MAIPWLRLLNAVIGVTDFAMSRRVENRLDQQDDRRLAIGSRTLGTLETHLAGVVVAALKEAFDRDSRRLDFEREQVEADRQRAERALRLELVRQAGERELVRLRFVAAVAVISWLGTLFFFARFTTALPSVRIALAVGSVMLLGALAATLVGQSSIGQTISNTDLAGDSVRFSRAGALASWLIVIGLAVTGAAVFIG
jgi:hypothetical protein